MAEKVVPMIHVPDVRATVDWYESIGFTVTATYGNEGDGLGFAILSFGSTEVMFNEGGQPSSRERREVDLYVYTSDVDELYGRLKDRVDVQAVPHDSFYGMREFIIRDLNRFWITFGQPSVFNLLMTAVRELNTESVRGVLSKGGVKPETLTAALTVASSGDSENAEIVEMLKRAGAVRQPEVDTQVLQSYVGSYKGEPGVEFNVTFKDGELFGAPSSQQPLRLMAVDQTTFRPLAFDDFGIITFNVEVGKTLGCMLNYGDETIRLTRVEEIKR